MNFQKYSILWKFLTFSGFPENGLEKLNENDNKTKKGELYVSIEPNLKNNEGELNVEIASDIKNNECELDVVL